MIKFIILIILKYIVDNLLLNLIAKVSQLQTPEHLTLLFLYNIIKDSTTYWRYNKQHILLI